MNSFIHHLISRHNNPAANIRPRLPGKFETGNFRGTSADAVLTNVVFQQPAEKRNDATAGNSVLEPGTYVTTEPANQSSHQETKLPADNKSSVMPGFEYGPGRSPDDAIEPTHLHDTAMIKHPHNNDFPNTMLPVETALSEAGASEDNNFKYQGAFGELNVAPMPLQLFPESNNHRGADSERPVNGYLNSTDGWGDTGQNALQNKTAASQAGSFTTREWHEPSTTIKISIGRIEVCAITESSPAKINRGSLQKPKLSLDDYLTSRNKGS